MNTRQHIRALSDTELAYLRTLVNSEHRRRLRIRAANARWASSTSGLITSLEASLAYIRKTKGM